MIKERRELRGARRKGRRDGRAGVPAVDQEALPFDLREILARAQGAAEERLARWRRQDQQLEAELDDATQRSIDAQARLVGAQKQLEAAEADHDRRTAEDDERLVRLHAQLEGLTAPDGTAFEPVDAEATAAPLALIPPITGGASAEAVAAHPATPFEQYTEPSGDASWRGLGPLGYWPLIALIVIGEIPLNAFAFRLFHESDLLTYAMTVTVAVGLVVFAHFVGVLLARPERTLVERVLTWVFLLVPILAIAVISVVRYDYLIDVGGDAGIGPLLGMLAFALINLLVFGAAVGLSYLRHDPRTRVNRRAAIRAEEREVARAGERRAKQQRREREHARREAEAESRRRLEEHRQRQQAALDARRQGLALRREQIAAAMPAIHEASREREAHVTHLRAEVDAAQVAFGGAQRAVQAAASERRALMDATHRELRALREHRDRLVFAYCSANVRARAGHATPPCLEGVPSLELPAGFGDLERTG